MEVFLIHSIRGSLGIGWGSSGFWLRILTGFLTDGFMFLLKESVILLLCSWIRSFWFQKPKTFVGLLDHTLSGVLSIIHFGVSSSSLHLVRSIVFHRLIHCLHRILFIRILVGILLVRVLAHLMVIWLIGMRLIVERLLLLGVLRIALLFTLTVFLTFWSLIVVFFLKILLVFQSVVVIHIK